MEGVAGFKPALEELTGFSFCGGRVHGGPFWWQLGAALEAPVSKRFGDALLVALGALVLKQPPPHHLADFGFVVGYQILGHASHDFGNALLPLEIPIGHLDLAAGQADDRCSSGSSSHGHSEILEKCIEGLSQPPMTIDKVQHFVKEEEHATASRSEEASQGLCPRRCGLRHSPQRLNPSVPG